jgi:transcriptional regulator GlxA family with amidase domain
MSPQLSVQEKCLMKIQAYLRENFRENIWLSAIAKPVGLSEEPFITIRRFLNGQKE